MRERFHMIGSPARSFLYEAFPVLLAMALWVLHCHAYRINQPYEPLWSVYWQEVRRGDHSAFRSFVLKLRHHTLNIAIFSMCS